jgi:hypothetical protein
VSATLADVAEEGRRLAERARTAGLALRLLGGVAVWLRCPSARRPPLARAYADADFAGRARDRREIAAFLEAEGYVPDKLFNALHGATRLNFSDPVRERPVDVLLDRFAMCHELDLRIDQRDGELTIPLADLLLTKLQVVRLNDKDARDILALLTDHALGPDAIDLERILDVTRADWGFEHTIHGTLATVRARADELGLEPARARAEELAAALNSAPKAARWRMRARVGERVRWYEEPEEARGG